MIMIEADYMDFDWIIPGILGASCFPDEFMFKFYKKNGIKAIFNLTGNPHYSQEVSGFKYHHIPIQDFSTPEKVQVEEFLSLTAKYMKQQKNTVCFGR